MSFKLNHQLNELINAEVITPKISDDIKNYYERKSANAPNKLFTVFGVLGGLLIGLGVILLLAHNWDQFSRNVKTIWAFAPLLVGQLFAAYALFKNKSSAWRETAATFLYFGIGASISLVSQIYNIPGSMSNFLLAWIILGAPLIYILRSHAAVLLHLIFITSYACNLGYFNNDIPWVYVLMIAWISPFYYQKLKSFAHDNLTGIYNWLLPLSVLISLGAFVSGDNSIGFVMYIMLFGLFYNIGKLPFFKSKRLRVNGYLLLGSLGTIIVLLITSFSWVWSDTAMRSLNNVDVYITCGFMISTIAILIHLFRLGSLQSFNLFQYTFLIFAAIYVSALFEVYVPMVLTNLLILSLGITLIIMGVRKQRFSILNYGLLVITVLTACRFFDTELSFIIRGLLFVAIGVGFFLTNYILYKKQNKIPYE